MRFLLLAGLLCGTAVKAADTRPEITWLYQAFPPAHITEGPEAGQGFADKTLAFIQAHLPTYRHRTILASLNRVHGEVAARETGCHMGLFRTPEREKFAVFSEPFIEVLPNRLITLADNLKRFSAYRGPEGAVKLALLGEANDLTVGAEGNRFYSPGINAFLKNRPAAQLVEMPDPRFAALLSRGRVDYAFAFSFEATYRFRADAETAAFVTLPVEGEPKLLFNQVGCNKSAFGAEVVAAINEQADLFRQMHRQYYAEWLDAMALADFQKAIANRP